MTLLRISKPGTAARQRKPAGTARHPLARAAEVSAPIQRLDALQRLADGNAPVQRMDEEEPMQGRFEPAQRMDEEEPLQGRFDPVQRQESDGGLPAGLRSGVESLSGFDMSDVRVHRNSPEPARIGAQAYAQGRDIHLGAGQERHLPHEAWHVVQQSQGRVPTTAEVNGVAVNDSPALEHEADVMGDRAAQTARR